MSRPERFDLRTAVPLAERPVTAAQPCPPVRAEDCAACPDELRCPFRALARLLAG